MSQDFSSSHFFNKLLISVRDEKEICGKEPGAVRYIFFAGIIRKKKSDSKIRKQEYSKKLSRRKTSLFFKTSFRSIRESVSNDCISLIFVLDYSEGSLVTCQASIAFSFNSSLLIRIISSLIATNPKRSIFSKLIYMKMKNVAGF